MNYFEYEPKRNNNPSRPLNVHGNQVYQDAHTRMRLGYEQDHPTRVPAEPQSSRKGVLSAAQLPAEPG
jgi:hypothetical protein